MSAGSSSKEPHATPKKVHSELVTPYKLTVAVLIKCYFQFKESDQMHDMAASDKVQLRKSFCIIALKVLQGPDLGLIEIRNLLGATPALTPVCHKFAENLNELHDNGIGKLLDVIEELKLLVNGESNQLEKSSLTTSTVLAKSSCIGYFLRRFIVFFEKLLFSDVSILHATFSKYYEEGVALAQSISTTAELNCDQWQEKPWSRRQAELFLATQAALLQNDEGRALNPDQLQAKIGSILKSNPDLAEAHFMSFLNYLRVEDICAAKNTLFHCFDRRTNPEVKVFNDDKSKEHRYAALNLAILHHHFGHMEEAVAAIKEAIKIAHEANDHYCLQHALCWMHRISTENKDNMIVQCIIKTFELNISYTTSLSLQDFAYYGCMKKRLPPYTVFETLSKSDAIISQHLYKGLSFTNNAMKSSLWRVYGKTDMCSLWAQVLLYMNIDTATQNTAYYGEGYLQSVCNIALNFLLEGEYALTNMILQYVKYKYPHEPLAQIWMLVENWSQYTLALYHENYLVADAAAQKIGLLDKWEGFLKLAEVNLHRGEYSLAEAYVGFILKNYKQDTPLSDGKFCLLRARVLQVEIQSAQWSGEVCHALSFLNICLIDAIKSELAYQIAIIDLHIAHSLLMQGMTTQALKNLNDPRCMAEIMAHGSVYDRARANLLYIKIEVAASDRSQIQQHCETLLKAAQDLEQVKRDFMKLEAYYRVKSVLYLQAKLYHTLNMEAERNNCSMECQILHERFPGGSNRKRINYL